MGGLQRLFLRITPIIMLICFICLGITHTFQVVGQENVTYLTSEVVTIDNNETPNDSTDDTTITNYSFDVRTYADTITENSILKQSLLNTIDLDTFRQNVETYDLLWADGYQFLDISKSILNTFVLMVNGFITFINVLIAPLRLCGALLLTGMSLVGINVNRDTGILHLLKIIALNGVIPLIGSAEEKPDDALTGTTWYWNYVPMNTNKTIKANFVSNNQRFIAIQFNFDALSNGQQVKYLKADEPVYIGIGGHNGNFDEAYRQLTFTNNDFDETKCNEIATQMRSYATQMINNSIWLFNSNLYNPADNTYTFNFNAYGSEGSYKQIIIRANDGIYYKDNDNFEVKVYESTTNTWIYEVSRNIKISNDTYTLSNSNQIWIFLSTYATKTSL